MAGQRVAVEADFKPLGAHIDGTAISSAVILSDTAPAGASKLLIQALTQNIRFTLDGSVPTATTGFQLKAGDPPVLIPYGSGTIITVIEEAASADLQAQWSK